MKITVILILVGILQVSATTYAQEHRISVVVENGTFYDVVSQIEKQSEFMFFYKSEEIDNNQLINLKADNKLVSEILNEITKNNNLTYKITGKHIIITKLSAVNQKGKVITGVIRDKSGEPIIGANVVVKGTTIGNVTDIDGKFSMEVPEKGILEISYIGYITQNMNVSGKNLFNIVLLEDEKTLEEVVVVGYGTVKKSDLTGAISQIDPTKREEKLTVNATDLLRNSIAGLNVPFSTNAKGSVDMKSVSIRGTNSLKASNLNNS